MTALGPAWRLALSRLDHAFQPIVRFAEGGAYGYEALLRGWEEAGFGSIAEVFDRAFEERILYALDLELRAKAFGKFAAAGLGGAKLFYNVDNRLLEMPDYATGNTLRLAREAGLSPSRVVFEISELHEPGENPGFDRVLASYRSQGFRIALDDFGSGYAGLKLLHRAEPDIVKIDRYFIAGSAREPRKAAFLEKIAGLSHLMGVSVVAEGIETAEELKVCADSGCDFAQGFFVAKPERDASALRRSYAAAFTDHASPSGERRSSPAAGTVGLETVEATRPIGLEADFTELLSRFRKEPSASLIPVVDGDGEAVGVYRERDFREYVYSPFGIAILEHLAAESGGEALLVKAPIAPLGSGLARIVEAYGASPESGGVILTEGGRYAGLIQAEALLSLVAERELVEARDQNPLTRLPGNLRVASVCAERLAEPGKGVAFAYFDFDNFKPFNDLYGFRNGDRVIMLFADILRSRVRSPRDFAGHLGGDDFFASVDAEDPGEALAWLAEASARFARDASSFYAPEDRERGWILGKDRAGEERKMGLLTASLAVVHLAPGGMLDAEGLSDLLAELKREAKASPDRLALRVVGPGEKPGGPGREAAEEKEGAGLASEAAQVRAATPAQGRAEERRGPPHPIFTPSLIAAF